MNDIEVGESDNKRGGKIKSERGEISKLKRVEERFLQLSLMVTAEISRLYLVSRNRREVKYSRRCHWPNSDARIEER